ncbi:MAG: 30S ribosomal protein S20 [Candidatus Kaelpia aquatica]|nr:30S ribosomal protein S20 [Candidatus Kaelpia aquatica]
MPNLKSACKRLKQNIKREAGNKTVKSELKTKIKKFRELVSKNKLPEAEEYFKELEKRLMQAGSKNIIHKNKASRHISRLQSLLNQAKVKK